MNDCFGLDISPSNVRWACDAVDSGMSIHSFPRLCGCPGYTCPGRKSEYDAIDTWGDPFAFRGHSFSRMKTKEGLEVDDIGHFLFVEPDEFSWLHYYFSRECRAHPPVLPDAVFTMAIPNGLTSRQQDDAIVNLPMGYGKSYLLWRPVTIVLDWLEGLTSVRDEYIDRRVFVLDLDGGYPEVSELLIGRHKERNEWIVPIRKPVRKGCRLTDGWRSEILASQVLANVEERDQLLKGPFAGDIQRQIESGESYADVWLREKGLWQFKRIRFADEIGTLFWCDMRRLLSSFDDGLKRGDVLICNGWMACRYRDQFLEHFSKHGVEVVIARPEAVSAGACIFSRRMKNHEPTYYDVMPAYQLWDGRVCEWVPLVDPDELVEPGSEITPDEIHLKIGRNNDNLSVYIRNADEATDEEDARRLKVSFTTFVTQDINIRLGISIRLARGSAEMTFEMEDKRLKPIFFVNEKPSRVLRFKYTIGDGGMVSGSAEPLHRGRLEPHPVLGRIYDSRENLEMVKLLLDDPKSGACRIAMERYRQATGFERKDELITSRVGYAANPIQPTRGLLGTKRLPNMPEVDKYARLLAARSASAGAKDFEKRQNYCHSAATDEYKASVRQKLRAKKAQNSWNFCYAPGYVLGDQPGDFELLLGYLINQSPDGSTTGKLWWSVFRMLCWHPESVVADTKLLEQALKKIIDEDAIVVCSTERKYVVLAILYACRAREYVNDKGEAYDFPSGLLTKLVSLLRSGVLAKEPFPKTMLPNLRPEGNLSDYVVRFLQKKDSLKDRELGAQMGCV